MFIFPHVLSFVGELGGGHLHGTPHTQVRKRSSKISEERMSFAKMKLATSIYRDPIIAKSYNFYNCEKQVLYSLLNYW